MYSTRSVRPFERRALVETEISCYYANLTRELSTMFNLSPRGKASRRGSASARSPWLGKLGKNVAENGIKLEDDLDDAPARPQDSPKKKKKDKVRSEAHILVLLSGQSIHREVVANQQTALTILKANRVSFETVDGADPANKERRNQLFAISGIRAKYPQFFMCEGADKTPVFWGGWDDFQYTNDNKEISQQFAEAITESSPKKNGLSPTPKVKATPAVVAAVAPPPMMQDVSESHSDSNKDLTGSVTNEDVSESLNDSENGLILEAGVPKAKKSKKDKIKKKGIKVDKKSKKQILSGSSRGSLDEQSEGKIKIKAAKKNVFVRDDENVWLPARIIEQNDKLKEATVQVFDLMEYEGTELVPREYHTLVSLEDYPNGTLPLKNVNQHTDMTDLPFLHEPGILYNLRTRFFQDKPYTRTGDVLVAINPYQWINNIYTVEKRKLYMPHKVYDTHSGMVKKTLEPHVYEISAMAFHGLAIQKQNQSILVSGESGAGKTETVKIALDHIATIQGGLKRNKKKDAKKKGEHTVMSDIVQRIVDTNPLLEAFGNAKTLRNDNSSRFGKFVNLQFDNKENKKSADSKDKADNAIQNCILVGSHIDVYLLEKSRVVAHAAGEQNFHIFYQILAASDDLKDEFGISRALEGTTPDSFPYLGTRNRIMKLARRSSIAGEVHSEDWIESLTDLQWLEQTLEELEKVDIQHDTVAMLMRALVAVLQLGNIQFIPDGDHAKIPNRQMDEGSNGELVKLAQLMEIDDLQALSKAFVNKTIMAGSMEIVTPLSPQQAKESCDAYAKELYSKIFLWLVSRINAATSASAIHKGVDSFSSTEEGPEHGMIGVLDIFGFEEFEVNRFEQMCINWANEALQKLFAGDIFIRMIEEYTREGLAEDVQYESNANVLDLIEGRMGIVETLNEECIRPKGSNEDFVSKFASSNRSSPRLHRPPRSDRLRFGINHFAGTVEYHAGDFLATNKDIMPVDLQKVSKTSKNIIVALVGQENGGRGRLQRRSSNNMSKNTVISKFQSQLNKLMNTLEQTHTRYIRCIKPNQMKHPRSMENKEVLRQLSTGGVIAAVKILSASYPNKMDHFAVLKRFRNLGEKPDRTQTVNLQVSTLLTHAFKDFVSPIKGEQRPPFTLGNTKTFFRSFALDFLENARNENIGFFALMIQRTYRMAPYRKDFLQKRRACIRIQAIMRGVVWRQRVARMPQCAVKLQSWGRMILAKIQFRRHQSAARIQKRWRIVRKWLLYERPKRAATSIQKVMRGFVQRRKYQKDGIAATKAAILIQKIIRGFVQWHKYTAFERRWIESNSASITIQRFARGYLQRTRFQLALSHTRQKQEILQPHPFHADASISTDLVNNFFADDLSRASDHGLLSDLEQAHPTPSPPQLLMSPYTSAGSIKQRRDKRRDSAIHPVASPPLAPLLDDDIGKEKKGGKMKRRASTGTVDDDELNPDVTPGPIWSKVLRSSRRPSKSKLGSAGSEGGSIQGGSRPISEEEDSDVDLIRRFRDGLAAFPREMQGDVIERLIDMMKEKKFMKSLKKGKGTPKKEEKKQLIEGLKKDKERLASKLKVKANKKKADDKMKKEGSEKMSSKNGTKTDAKSITKTDKSVDEKMRKEGSEKMSSKKDGKTDKKSKTKRSKSPAKKSKTADTQSSSEKENKKLKSSAAKKKSKKMRRNSVF